MKLEMFQVVRLTDGSKATIVEIYNDGEGYEVDVVIRQANIKADPPEYGEYETRTIFPNEIATVFTEVETAFTAA